MLHCILVYSRSKYIFVYIYYIVVVCISLVLYIYIYMYVFVHIIRICYDVSGVLSVHTTRAVGGFSVCVCASCKHVCTYCGQYETVATCCLDVPGSVTDFSELPVSGVAALCCLSGGCRCILCQLIGIH